MRERDKDEFAILAELVDWDEPDDPRDDDDDTDFTVDDVSVGPRFGCDGDAYFVADERDVEVSGAYFVETNSGPGAIVRR